MVHMLYLSGITLLCSLESESLKAPFKVKARKHRFSHFEQLLRCHAVILVWQRRVGGF